MKELLYDWFGMNEWLFSVLYSLNFPLIDTFWGVVGYAYSYWAVGALVLFLALRYLSFRHSATAEQIQRLGEIFVALAIAFSVVWCVVYTFQNITLLPRPWMVFPEFVAAQAPVYSHEGLPASAAAISVMLAMLVGGHCSGQVRKWLVLYVAVGCVLSVVSGVNWPVEVVAGAAVGWVGAVLGKWYLRLGRRIVAP